MAFGTRCDQFALRFVIVREGFCTKLDAEKAFAESFVTDTFLMSADEGTDEDGALAGCEDAAVHVCAALLIGEVAAHMNGHEWGIKQAHLAYS